MYQISHIKNTYNFEENCVVTVICANNSSNKDDNGESSPTEVAIYKKFCQDKTEEEMKKFVSPFSLTSLCVAADLSADDIIKDVGKPFKRCFVRLTDSSVSYNVDDMVIHTCLYVDVSLNPAFDKVTPFIFANESPLTTDFLKQLQIDNIAGYKPFKNQQ